MARYLSRVPVLAIGLALLAAGGALMGLVLGGGGAAPDAGFRQRGMDYVAAFAEAASAWLREGDTATLEDAARFMLLGSAAAVEVVWRGEPVVRVARVEMPEAAPSGVPAAPEAEVVSLSGAKYLEILYPLDDGEGFVRVALEVPPAAGPPWWMATAASLALVTGLLLTGGWLWERTRPALREKGKPAGEVIELDGLVIDEGKKEVRLFDRPVKLSPKQYALLLLLAREPGRVFSDKEILAALWAGSRYANSKDVKQYVYLLRRRLGAAVPGAEALIATVPGFGYRLLSPKEIGLTPR